MCNHESDCMCSESKKKELHIKEIEEALIKLT